MKKIFILFITLVLNISCSEDQFKPQSDNRLLMGTICIITLYNGEDQEIFDGAFNIIEKEEQLMSLQRDDSELSLINSNAGIEALSVSDDTYSVVEASLYYSELTGGAFDPTIAPLVNLWSIGENLTGNLPPEEEIVRKRDLVDYRKLEMADNNSIFLSEKGMKIDLGGIAKGYIGDKVKKYFLSSGVGRGIINLGGNIVVIGSKPEEMPWKIGIQNPLEPRGNHIGIARIIDKTVVTSGIYERYFFHDGVRYHHILNPVTGYPVDNDLASVTIISEKSIDADALSTSLFVLGVEEGMELIEQIEDSEAVFVTKDKKVIYSSGAGDLFTLLDEEYEEISLDKYLNP